MELDLEYENNAVIKLWVRGLFIFLHKHYNSEVQNIWLWYRLHRLKVRRTVPRFEAGNCLEFFICLLSLSLFLTFSFFNRFGRIEGPSNVSRIRVVSGLYAEGGGRQFKLSNFSDWVCTSSLYWARLRYIQYLCIFFNNIVEYKSSVFLQKLFASRY